jgi:riboflavin synthase
MPNPFHFPSAYLALWKHFRLEKPMETGTLFHVEQSSGTAPEPQRRIFMFTGLIEACKPVRAVSQTGGLKEIEIDLGDLAEGVAVGDSVALNGVCLTVVSVTGSNVRFQVVRETQERSTLGQLRQGDLVNIERSLRVGDRLGGHFVQGHVDGIGRMLEKRQDGQNVELRFRADPATARYLVEKGSVCVDGVSLTLGVCKADTFSVHLIPHTLDQTTLRFLRSGDPVNLEADIIGKYVEKLLSPQGTSAGPPQGVSIEFLEKYGFGSPRKG